MKIAGIVLIVLGILALVYQNFSYTQTKQDVKIGTFEVQHQEPHDVTIPPAVGVVFIVAGVALVVVGRRNKL